MKTIVEFQSQARPSIARWFATMGRGEDRVRMARFFFQEIVRYLEVNNGMLPEALVEPGINPKVYWWGVTAGVWIRYCIRDDEGFWAKLFGRQVRKVFILGMAENLPDNLIAGTLPE